MNLADEVNRSIGRGLKAATIFAKARIQELVSTPPAWKRRRVSASGREYYIVPPATPGAPPRKITGAFRRSFATLVVGNRGFVGSPMPQSARLEFEGHPYLSVVLQRHGNDIGRIAMGG